MIYFVSFNNSNHNSNIDIIKLENKLSIVKFCKTHPNDIICYINKNSIVNDDPLNILNKYYQLKQPLVFSKEFTNIIDKYKHDKIQPYDPCYIGTSEAIINYYTGKYEIYYDDTIFHTSDSSLNSISIILPKNNNFLPEMLLFIIVSALFYFNHIILYFLSLIIICVFIEYQLLIKHLHVNNTKKILYILIDIFHVFIQFFIFYLFFNFNCNVTKLLFLNICYLIVIFLFFIFKQCILSVFHNLLTDEYTTWNGIDKRIIYFIHLNKSYIKHQIYNNHSVSNEWISGNKLSILALIGLNAYFFMKCKLKK